MSYETANIVWIDGEPYSQHHPLAKAVLRNRDPGEAPKLERNPGDGALGAVPVQEKLGGRFLVRVTAIRSRLLDEDNLCEKYHVDLCRYTGVLPSDAPGKAKIEVTQEKVEPGAEEKVRIQVWKL